MWVIRTKINNEMTFYEIGYYKIIDQLNKEIREVVHYHEFVLFDICEDKLEAIALCSKLNGGN